jgi:uncharacterized membrane protein
MRLNVRQLVDRIRVSYWFVPLAMGLLAVLLARVLLWVDTLVPNSLLDTGQYTFGGTPEQARTAMLGIVGVTLGTAGIVFSLLTVPFSVVVSQYGSRLLRIYMRDVTFQLILGVFVATIVYCLNVALAIPASTVPFDSPQIASTVGLLLALVTVASLIVLIHHIGKSLQAPNLVASAGSELREVVLSGSQQAGQIRAVGEQADVKALQAQVMQEGYPVYAADTGYIQAIDIPRVRDLVGQADLVIQLTRKPGHFVQPGVLIARAWSAKDIRTEEVIDRIRQTYLLGNLRTPVQDVEYAVMQVAEVAVRAMSPAINDPYTAVSCLHHIGAGLALFAAQGERTCCFYDHDGRLRLIHEPVTLGELLEAAFGMLRRASRDNAQVLLAILTAIEQIAQKAERPEAKAELLKQVRLVEAESRASAAVDWDRERIGQRCAELADLLQA